MNTPQLLTIPSRILMAFASGMLVAVFFLPAWRIDLYAPQYPEGLILNIWINKLTGNVDIINGLNHYIGMKPFSDASFPEFKYLSFVVYFFMAFAFLISLTGKRKLLVAYLILATTGGVLAIYDFYQWGYSYGHDLDPKAAIQVPGFSYQPPVLGHKRLLNFDAYSFPDIGGWIVIASVILAFAIFFYEWYIHKKKGLVGQPVKAVCIFSIISLFNACSSAPEPLKAGQDACSYCHMTIVQPEYGGELITQKGKVFKFDDFACLTNFINTNKELQIEIKHIYITNFAAIDQLIVANDAYFYQSSMLKSPMGSNTCAFKTEVEAIQYKGKNEGTITTWAAILKAK